ncbi:hypothetical protein L6452_34687 [Arctium lappa]|uniref:Uncharacterized protein n=2 Tax=Arctium lappa TaxID=4217 RepID=A0ACB8YIY2_ARCLA|nr:hypothetical protein L6452_34686 [Arctium lappa]KAI3685445.1 hypothetical protein L6452_34687 [Arctium lappa]
MNFRNAPEAHVISTKFTKSVIKSCAALSYVEAQSRMDDRLKLLGHDWLFVILGFIESEGALVRYTFVVQENNYTRLCSSKNILTVNGQYPGPTISARRGDTVIVDVINQATQNITIHC